MKILRIDVSGVTTPVSGAGILAVAEAELGPLDVCSGKFAGHRLAMAVGEDSVATARPNIKASLLYGGPLHGVVFIANDDGSDFSEDFIAFFNSI